MGIGSFFQEQIRDPLRESTGLDIAGFGVGNLLGGGLGGAVGLAIDPLTGAINDITGRSAEEAARRAAGLQEDAGQRAITVAEEAQRRLEESLAPFAGALGTDLLPQAQGLFGPTAGASIAQDPALQALLDESQRRIQASQAAQGRPAGETDVLLQDAFLRTGSDLLSRQRSDLLSALGVGQASAAQTGVSGINTAGRTGDLLTQIANAQAAGQVGAAQAGAAGTQNVVNLLGQGLGLLFSDRRLKRNITRVGKYKEYDAYKYQYKSSDQWYYGVMAQDVQAINPGAVLEKDGYLMVDYGVL
jgi:hypothetical protein